MRVRWVIFGYMFAFAFVIYLQRTSFSVTAVQMMPELGITQVELGWLFTAYLIIYTVFQLPGGIFGEWLGARKALVVTGLVGFCAAIATPLVPLLLAGSAMLLRTAHRPDRAWPGACAAVSGLDGRVRDLVSGGSLGIAQWAADGGPAVRLGGRDAADRGPDAILRLEECAAVDDAPGLALVALWSWYGRNSPAEHPRVSAAERAELEVQRQRARGRRHQPARPAAGPGQPGHPVAGHLVHDHELRVLPAQHLVFPVPGAGAAPVGARKRLAGESPVHRRRGRRRDRRQSCPMRWPCATDCASAIVPCRSSRLPLAGLLLFAGVESTNPYLAVGALSLAFAAIEITEAAYSAATTAVAREHTMTAWGVVGTGGNLGGVIGTPLVAVLSAHHAWTAAFLTGTVFAIVSGVLWLWIDGSRVLGSEPSRA